MSRLAAAVLAFSLAAAFIPPVASGVSPDFAADADDSRALLELLPRETVAAACIERPRRVLPPPMLNLIVDGLAPDRAAARALARALRRLPGPMLLALTDLPGGDRPPRFIAAFALGKRPADFDKLMSDTVLPAIDAWLGASGSGRSARIEPSGDVRRVLLDNDRELFAWTRQSQIVFLSTDPDLVRRWRRGEFPGTRLAVAPPLRRLLETPPDGADLRVLINTAPLWKLLPRPSEGEPQQRALRALLHPEDVRGAVLTLSSKDDRLTLSLTAALADDCRGLARLLHRAGGAPVTLASFPPDYYAVGRLAFSSLGDVIDDIYRLVDRIDPEISAEYRAELGEFRDETGVDLDGLFRNLVTEITVGVRYDMARPAPLSWVAVGPLRHAEAAASSLDNLIEAFALPLQPAEETIGQRRVPLRSIGGGGPGFAIDDQRLIVADSVGTIRELLEHAAGDESPPPPNARLAELAALAPPGTWAAFMLDAQTLSRKTPVALAATAFRPSLGMLLGRMAGAIFVSGAPQTIRLDAVLTFADSAREASARVAAPDSDRAPDETDAQRLSPADEALSTATESVALSIRRARALAAREVRSANMRGITQGFYIYANAHKNRFPDSLQELIDAGIATHEMFADPLRDRDKPADPFDPNETLLYRRGLTLSSAPNEIVLAERFPSEEGGWFFTVDGHGEFIPQPEASQLIARILAGEPSVRSQLPQTGSDEPDR